MSALLLAALLWTRADADRIDVLFSPTGEKRLLQERISAELRAASKEIRVALYHFTSERLAQALAERRKAGTLVRVLLDGNQADEDQIARLRGAGLDVRRVFPRDENARFHHKFCVLDDDAVVTGSYNWTVLADTVGHENVVILRSPAVARTFRDEFDRIWQDKALSRP